MNRLRHNQYGAKRSSVDSSALNSINTKNQSIDEASASLYRDILFLPPFHDTKHPAMSPSERAAQFAPYKSLAVDGLYDTTESSIDEDYQIIWDEEEDYSSSDNNT